MKITDLISPNPLSSSDKTEDKNFSKIDFLESLLKNIDNFKEIKDIILHSNISKEEKDKLLQKFLDKNLKNTPNNPLLDTKQLTPKPKVPISVLPDFNGEFTNKTTKDDKKLSLEDLLKNKDENKDQDISFNNEELTLLSTLETKITNTLKEESEIVKKVKIIIIQKSINNPNLQKIVNESDFKKASSFNDLLKLSEKFNLNLVKIALSKKDKNNTPKTELPDFDSINRLKPKIQQPLSEKNTPKKTTQKTKVSINDLLNINPKKEPVKETRNKNETSINNLLNLNPKKEDTKHIKNEKADQTIPIQDIKTDPIKKDEKKDNEFNNQFSNITVNDIKNQIISAKQTIKHFVSNLKEAVENYKPPVSKLTLELHPKDLGKVEVTIKQRGDNLNVQINTNNSTTINFFTSSQQELKNSLVNMGFTNINMSFNSNQDNQQKQNQPQSKYSKNDKNNEDEELVIDFSYKYA